MAGSDGIDVQLGNLGEFATTLAEDGKAFGDEMRTAMTSPPRLGHGGLKEAAYAATMNGHRLGDTGKFLGDAMLGVQALAQAAMVIQANYMGSDATGAATVSDVNNAFTANADTPGSVQANAAAAEQAERDVRAANPGVLPNAQDTTPDRVATDDSAESDAEERVRENRDEFGQMQDWNPDSRPDEPTILAPGVTGAVEGGVGPATA